jgi:hypothetical protein
MTSDAIQIADALRVATDRAATLLEQDDNENMRSAALGVLPDGTPVEDMLLDLKETKAREASLRSLLRSIKFYTNTGSAKAYPALKAIRELINKEK